MYESPIEKIFGEIQSQIIKQDEENMMYEVKQAVGYSVDKNELIKALKYDREQYEKGYHDGLNADKWIPVSERLPELNKPLLVTAYHRVCYAHMISESGNYGYPVFRLHEIKDSDRGWVQETISHEPYSKGRIDAWMYIDIPEPYKAESEDKE